MGTGRSGAGVVGGGRVAWSARVVEVVGVVVVGCGGGCWLGPRGWVDFGGCLGVPAGRCKVGTRFC